MTARASWQFRHSLVVDHDLSCEALELAADPGRTLIDAAAADPDSPSQQALRRLANWSSSASGDH